MSGGDNKNFKMNVVLRITDFLVAVIKTAGLSQAVAHFLIKLGTRATHYCPPSIFKTSRCQCAALRTEKVQHIYCHYYTCVLPQVEFETLVI